MINPFPEHIRTVAVIAPAGPAPEDQIKAGCGLLENLGIKVKLMPGVQNGKSQASYLSATVKQRLEDLHNAWSDSEVDLILCVRGGYGCAHLLPEIDWKILKSRSLPLVGYSDITALHLAMLKYNAGIPVAAPMCAMLPRIKDDDFTMSHYHRVLSASKSSDIPSLKPLKTGRIEAPVVAVNLAVTVTMCGTDFMPDLTGKVLLVEDIGEPVYKIDRYLTQLRQCGILDSLGGLVFGSFTGCNNNDELGRLQQTIADEMDFPVFSGFPFGHDFPFVSIRQNARIAVEANGTVSL